MKNISWVARRREHDILLVTALGDERNSELQALRGREFVLIAMRRKNWDIR
ncbi:MAG: hypothetical protein ACPL7D_08175 [Candidatus Sumerlaeaceae bacterium]|jgi:hypothetical protein